MKMKYAYTNNELKKIYDGNELAELVRNSVEFYKAGMIDVKNKAAKTKEEVKQEVVNEYEAENKILRDQLRFAVATLSSEEELEAYNAFVAKHNQSCRNTKATGGMMPYIKQIGHGLGCCTTVYCQVCGASEDITDSSVW